MEVDPLSLPKTPSAVGQAYLRSLFERLPATDPADLEALLPHRVDRDALARR